MVTGITIREVEETVATSIAAIDPTPFLIGARDTFHEAEHPLTAVEDTTALSHLAFSVSVETAPVADDEMAEPEAGSVTVMAELVVIFVHKIVATKQVRNYRAASDAARAVLRAVMTPQPHFAVQPLNVFKPGNIQDGWMPVEMRFRLLFDLTY